MLQNIRDNSQGWIAKTIIGVIVLLLSLTGFDAIFNAVRTDNLVAKVGDIKIHKAELEQAVNSTKQRLMAQYGNDFDLDEITEAKINKEVLAQLIKTNVILQNAQKFDFNVPKTILDRIIVEEIPEFKADGKFSQDLFVRYVNSLGYSVLQFRDMLTQDVLTRQLQQSVASSSFVTKSEIENFIKLERQLRDFGFFIIKANPDDIKPSDEQLINFYQEHLATYIKPEQVIAEYIELKKSKLLDEVKVTDEQLQDAYKAYIADIKEQRYASHILLEVNKERSEQEAKTQITQIAQRIKQGDDFAKVAQEVSEDFITAQDGGNLGVINLGELDNTLEQAIYSLATGQVSEPVRTSYGFHLIKVNNIVKPVIPEFSAIKNKLEEELKADLVGTRFIEISKELDNLAYESSDLTGVAEQLSLSVQTSDPVLKGGGSGIFANPKVVKALFSDEVLQDGANSALIELDPDTYVVVRAKEHQLPTQLEFADVKEKVTQDYMQYAAKEQAKKTGEELLAKVKQDQQAVKWHELVNQDRRGLALGDAEKQELYFNYLLNKVFALPKPSERISYPYFTSIELPGSGDIALIKLNKIHEFIGKLDQKEIDNYKKALVNFYELTELDAYIATLVKNAKVKYY